MKEDHQLVEHTNDWSIDSKRSMVELGYFEDNFIKYFSKKKRRSPLINICYFVRSYVIDQTLKHFISLISSKKYQVISLGAGFDTTYFRLLTGDNNVLYIEIDLYRVVEKKINVLLNNEETKRCLGHYTLKTDESSGNRSKCFLRSDHYILFSQNLCDLKGLHSNFKSLHIDYSLPTIFLSECAVTYMDESSCNNLCKFISENFSNSAFLIYEQINPEDGFGQFMMQHFETIQNPLKALTRYKHVKEPEQYYIDQGWEYSEMYRVLDLYNHLSQKDNFISKITIEPIDEWEEFHLTCLHYALYIAANGPLRNAASSFPNSKISTLPVTKQLNWCVNEINDIRRFSHSLVMKDHNRAILFGGVGVENSCHKKNSLIEIINLENNEMTLVQTVFNHLAQTYIACCKLECDSFLIHGGCKSPSREGDADPYIINIQEPNLFKLSKVSIEIGGMTSCHRWRHTAVSFGRDIFIFGGRTHDLKVLRDLWKLSLSKNMTGWSGRWSQLESGPSGRFSHSCVKQGNDGFLISGGLDCNIQPLHDVWSWNRSQGWTWLNIIFPLARYGHTSHLVGNVLFLVGGITFHTENPVLTLVNLETLVATHFTLPYSHPGYPVMLHNHQSILSNDNKSITIVGGGGNCFSFGTSFNKHNVIIPVEELTATA